MPTPDPDYVRWLVEQSMLYNVRPIAMRYSGQGSLWQRPYAEPQPRAASSVASVWFTAYPPSIITRPGESVLRTLGDEALWRTLAAIGVRAIHTGPTKLAGGLRGREHTPFGVFSRVMSQDLPAEESFEGQTVGGKYRVGRLVGSGGS